MTNQSLSPLVTIVTVTYNLIKSGREQAFKQAVASLKQQNYPNIEHLIIDGASNDGTLDLLADYEKKGDITYISEPDKGIYDAMNKGIAKAKGKYIAFLNSDDFYHDANGISASVELLEQTGAAFSYAPRNYVKTTGELICIEGTAIGTFAHDIPFTHVTMISSTQKLRQYNGFDLEYKYAADYDLILRLLLNGESGAYVPLNYSAFREGGASDTSASFDEVRRIRQKLFGIQNESIINQGYLDDNLMQFLISKIHPKIAIDLLRCYSCVSTGIYKPVVTRILKKTSESVPSCKQVWRLFNLIPLLKRSEHRDSTTWSLFSAIPIWRKQVHPQATIFYLFNILPVIHVKTRHTS